jgi:kumamolisin
MSKKQWSILIRRLFLILFYSSLSISSYTTSAEESNSTRLHGHIPFQAMRHANVLGRLAADQKLALTVSLPLRNKTELEKLILRQQDPTDPEYGHYLTPKEFSERFSPSQADYQAVAAHFSANGFTISRRHSNRQLLSLEANTKQIESSLHLRIHRYQDKTGQEFYAPDNEPLLPSGLAKHILHVAGLNNAVVRHTYVHQQSAKTANVFSASIGSGPQGGLTPNDIATAYNAKPNLAASKYPQTLAVLELADYYPDDISYYQNYFNLGVAQNSEKIVR